MTADALMPGDFGDEAEQVGRARERDSAIWAHWYDIYYPLLFRYAYVRIGRREDAEDVTSQVFLEALKAIHGFTYRGRPVLAWLYGIARNLVAQKVRQDARASKATATLMTDETQPGHAEQVLAHIDLTRAIARLTRDQQDVLAMRFFLSMSLRETAEALGKTENAIAVLQVRALASLRRHMSKEAVSSIISSRRGGGRG